MGMISTLFQTVTGQRGAVVREVCTNKQRADLNLARSLVEGNDLHPDWTENKAWSAQYHMDKNEVTPDVCREYGAWNDTVEKLTGALMDAYADKPDAEAAKGIEATAKPSTSPSKTEPQGAGIFARTVTDSLLEGRGGHSFPTDSGFKPGQQGGSVGSKIMTQER